MTDEQVAAAESAVRAAGAVALKDLEPDTLVEALVNRGLEKTPKVVRVPLGEQLAALVAAEGDVPLAGVDKRLAGASAAEAKQAALELVRAGTVAIVKQDKAERLVPADSVAGADDIERASTSIAALKELVKDLEAQLKATRPGKAGHGYGLLQEDLKRWRGEVRAAIAVPQPSAPPPAAEAPPVAQAQDNVAERVLQTIVRLDRDPLLHLVYLPDLVRELGRIGVGVATAHSELLAAAEAGKIDLRPESEPERLPSGDRAVCLTSPAGRLISYVRTRQ